MKNIIKFLILLTAVLLFSQCKKDPQIIDISLKGKINGHIVVYDEGYDKINKENVKVYVKGTDIYTTTDTAGRYSLKDVPTGTYDITFTRDDLVYYEYQDIQVVGGESPVILMEISLTKPSTISIVGLKDSIISLYSRYIYVNFERQHEDIKSHYVTCFFDTVYHEDMYLHTNEYTYAYGYDNISRVYFPSKFTQSDTVYVVAYPGRIVWSWLTYIDRNSGEIVFPGINTDKPSDLLMIINN